MATVKIIDKETREVLGEVVANHSLSFDEAMELAGFKWVTFPAVEADGWSNDNGRTVWDQSVAELVTE